MAEIELRSIQNCVLGLLKIGKLALTWYRVFSRPLTFYFEMAVMSVTSGRVTVQAGLKNL